MNISRGEGRLREGGDGVVVGSSGPTHAGTRQGSRIRQRVSEDTRLLSQDRLETDELERETAGGGQERTREREFERIRKEG